MHCLLYHVDLELSSPSPIQNPNRPPPPYLQLGEGEAATLGPMWPRPRDLAALQGQCMGVLYSMADAAPRGGGLEGGGRRKQVCMGVLKVMLLLSDFLDAVGYPPSRRASERSMREQLAAVEAALSAGETLPSLLGGAPLSPLSPTTSLGSPLSVQ